MIWRKIWDFHWHQKERPPLSCHHLTGLKCGVESIFIYLLYVFKAFNWLLTVSILLLWGSPQLKPLSPALKDILALGICIITRYAPVCVLCLCCLNIVWCYGQLICFGRIRLALFHICLLVYKSHVKTKIYSALVCHFPTFLPIFS